MHALPEGARPQGGGPGGADERAAANRPSGETSTGWTDEYAKARVRTGSLDQSSEGVSQYALPNARALRTPASFMTARWPRLPEASSVDATFP